MLIEPMTTNESICICSIAEHYGLGVFGNSPSDKLVAVHS